MENDKPSPTTNPSLRETLEEQHSTARDQIAAAWQLYVTRLEEQIATGWKEHVEHVIGERFQETTARVEEAFAKEMESRLADMRQRLRRDFSDRLNRLLRRLRKSEPGAEMHTALVEGAGMFCQRAALFVVDGQMLRCDGSRDFAADASGQLADTVIPLASAPALVSAVEGADTVIAMRTAAELSEQLAGFFGENPEKKTGLFPIVCRGKTAGVLCADGGEGEADIPGLELMTMLAGVTLEARAAAPQQPAPAEVPLAPQVLRVAAYEADWSQVPEKDRALHMRAQRFARVQVAEMRLYQAQAVRKGRSTGDLYSTLKDKIDAARESFRTDFLAPCASMTDYLHLELVRTLANDDASLLGQGYPGPLV
jgi:hypothetical protein